jgi:long-chain acyl-CoA synthetase
VKNGDVVAIYLSNCVEYIIIYFACMHVGATVVPLNYRLHPTEIQFILEGAMPHVLFRARNFTQEFDCCVKHTITFVPNAKDGEEYSFFNWLQGIEPMVSPFEDLGVEDAFVVMYTSGTTGMPKGVEITCGALVKNGMVFKDAVELSPDFKFYNILDLAYLGGFYNLMLIPFLSQASIVLGETFDPRSMVYFWDHVKNHGVNALWLVPSILSILLAIDRSDAAADYCKKFMKRILVGTAPLASTLKEKFEKRYNVVLYENYGLSETLFITTNSPKDGKCKGVGRVLQGCEVVVVDVYGAECAPGREGEIIVKTPYRMKGYLGIHDCSLGNIDQGQDRFQTGDWGYIDEDGYLFITGRTKDIIIRGGINISPKQIEDVLLKHPVVEEVAVVGMPNDFLGEEIIACIRVRSVVAPQEIIRHCQQYLAAFKVPAKVVFVEQMPRSVTGKIQKGNLKKLLAEG